MTSSTRPFLPAESDGIVEMERTVLGALMCDAALDQIPCGGRMPPADRSCPAVGGSYRLTVYNPGEDIRIPKRRKQDADEQVIARDVVRNKLLPAVPDRYRGLVAVAGGAGLRWGRQPDCVPTLSTWTLAGCGDPQRGRGRRPYR